MLLIAARFFQFSAACALFGGGFFDLWCQFRTGWGVRPAVPLWSLLLIASSLAGLWAITETITDAPPTPDAMAAVLTGTGIGHVWIFRFVVMMILLPTAWAPRLRLVPTLLGGVLLGSLAWAGHGAMNEDLGGAIHLAADVGHLLGAGLWLGALPVLLGLLNRDRAHAHAALVGFAATGTAAVGLLGVSGLVNAWFLIGPNHIRDLPSTTYGWLLIAKLGLFAAMLGLASLNRWILTPALLRDGPAHLRLAIGVELACGVLVLAAVAWMGTLVPTISTGSEAILTPTLNTLTLATAIESDDAVEVRDVARHMVDSITPTPDGDALHIDIRGELATILSLANGRGAQLPEILAEQIKLVAGVRNHRQLTLPMVEC